MADESPYRIGKLGIGLVVALAILTTMQSLLNQNPAFAIGNFIGALIFGIIAISIIKFVYVAGKRTLLQDATDES